MIDAPNKEVALAQINAMKGYSKKALNLPLSEIWTKYEVHPDRARPLTPHEPLMYRSTLQEFIDYAHGITGNPKNKRSALSSICEVTSEFVSGFVDYLKTTKIAVDTHNRKLRRLRKIFDCLKDYYDGENPFRKEDKYGNSFFWYLYSLPNLVSKNMVDLLPEELLCAFDHPNCYRISPEDLWLYYRKGIQFPEQ